MKKFAIVIAASLVGALPAVAHESCQSLRIAKLSILDKDGFCFRRPADLKMFPNNPRTCETGDPGKLYLDGPLARTLLALNSKEKRLGCRG